MPVAVDVKYDAVSDEYYIEWDGFEELGWQVADDIVWEDNKNGSFTLTNTTLNKKENNMNYQKDVTEFMVAADQFVGETPHFPELTEDNFKQASLYIDLIDEEMQELAMAFILRNIGGVADGGADLVWVIQGLFVTLGIDFDKVWEEVKTSNMSKVSDNGKIIKREDGKVLKPDTYFKPDIEKVLRDQGL
jgi:hypothetical protein